jgi:cytochrome c2
MKNRFYKILITSLLLSSASTSLLAKEKTDMVLGNEKNGAKLHQKYCTACHKNEVYTRKAKTVKSLAGLSGRVKACGGQVGANFSREQAQDVTKYLNSSFYKFKL